MHSTWREAGKTISLQKTGGKHFVFGVWDILKNAALSADIERFTYQAMIQLVSILSIVT